MTRTGRSAPGFAAALEQRRDAGFGLLEIMVASALLIIVFAGVSQFYVGGRRSVDYEEDRRAATAFLADRMETIRREYHYDHLPALQGVDTTYTVDFRTYRISHEIVPETPEANATTIRLTVSWNAMVAGAPVSRSMHASTILARGAP
jgi:type II secretory pathway pseudopilin PulG